MTEQDYIRIVNHELLRLAGNLLHEVTTGPAFGISNEEIERTQQMLRRARRANTVILEEESE